jgi:transposase
MNELPADRKVAIYEAGNQMKWVSDTLKKIEGVRPHPVHPNEVKWIVSSNGKTDKVDARKMAELGRVDMLPRPVHIVEGKARELREYGSARLQLQSKRVSLINTLRGYVRQEGVNLPVKFFQRKDWQSILRKSKISPSLRDIIESFMSAINALVEAEKAITEKFTDIEDKRCELLETIPAIGKLTSRVLVGAWDDVSRFDGKKQIANYGALTPTIYQSGNVTQLGKINRDGRSEIRRAMLQCAHTVARTN